MSVAQTTFVGVDLAWAIERKTSAVAVLQGDLSGAELATVSGPVCGPLAVVQAIVGPSAENCVVAIDAPLVVRNESGQRTCERMVSQRFGYAHAGCHTTNLRRPNAATGPALVVALQRYGFRHDLDLTAAAQRAGRWLFEVYPHPAMVQIWRLDRIISYKKGGIDRKRAGLYVLREHLLRLAQPTHGLRQSALLNEILTVDLQDLRGQRLKDYEDTLDAIFCAYLAWYCWRWGAERNEMFGTLDDGYIVVPRGSVQPGSGHGSSEKTK